MNPEKLTVTSGTNRLDPAATRRNLKRIIVNLKYVVSTHDSDIALLELKRALPLNAEARAIQPLLPEDEATLLSNEAGLDVTGWGAVTEGGGSVRILNFINSPYVERDTCNLPLSYDGRITANMIWG